MTKTRGDQALGRAKLARLFFLVVVAAVLSLAGTGHYAQAQPGEANGHGLDAGGVAPSGEGPGRVTAAPVTYSFTVGWGDHQTIPNYDGYVSGVMGSISPETFTYEGSTYTVTSVYRLYTSSWRTYVKVSPGLPGRWVGASLGDTSWTCPTATTSCSRSGSDYDTSLTIQLHPAWSIGTPSATLVTTDPSNIAVEVSASISNAGSKFRPPLTWSITPTPEGATFPVDETAVPSLVGSVLTVSKTFTGLAPNTQYTVTVKKQGAADSTAQTVQAIQSFPGSIDLGTPSSEFSGTGLSSHTLTVTIPASVPDDASATQVPLTWTIDPTPDGASSPEHAMETIDGSGNVVKVWSGLSPFTPYTITAKEYGAPDSEAKSLSATKIPGHVPFQAPAILKVTDQTPDKNDTASLQVTWSGAPALPVTGYWLRYNLGGPLIPDEGQETNIIRNLPPIPRSVGTVDVEVQAYYTEDTEVTYRGRDHTVPTGETWFSTWSETHSINIARASRTGSEVPPKPVAPLVVDTAGKLLEASGLPADQAHSYSLLFLLFLTLGVGGFLYAATGGGPMSATLAGFVGVIIWSGLGWWWFGLPVAMALVPLMLIIIVGGMVVTTRVLS